MEEPRLHPWEPEETIGLLWHRFVTREAAEPFHEHAAVTFEEMRGRIGVMFRGQGGGHAVEIGIAAEQAVAHRRSFFRRLGHAEERSAGACFDGERFSLPPVIGAFEDRKLNEACFLWLSAYVAHDHDPPADKSDAAANDIERLRHTQTIVRNVLTHCPGLSDIYGDLCAAHLVGRQTTTAAGIEADIEAAIRSLLGSREELSDLARQIRQYAFGTIDTPPSVDQPKDYHLIRPVPHWPEQRMPTSALRQSDNRSHEDGAAGGEGGKKRKKARRRKSDQSRRKDSFILNRFETILSWTDYLNINRKVEDDDEANARKAADDADALALTDIDQTPATRLAFDLDMAPQDIDRARLSAEITYPEWDCRSLSYLPDHTSVRLADLPPADQDELPERTKKSARRLNAVRRQFEALKPKRRAMPRQPDGDELDIDATIRSLVDIRVSGTGSSRVYRNTINAERDLAVAILVDTSRSTESAVGPRSVIDIAKESLVAFGYGLEATGDRHAIYSFSSLRRDKVFVNRVKTFDEPMNAKIEARIAALRPGFYTRLGAAIRHAASELHEAKTQRKLLLVLTDGKPNDLDHYEGRYGIEDSRMAVLEARRQGLAVFAIAIDAKAQHYIPRIFGQNGYAIVSHPEKLFRSLPQIYRHLVT